MQEWVMHLMQCVFVRLICLACCWCNCSVFVFVFFYILVFVFVFVFVFDMLGMLLVQLLQRTVAAIFSDLLWYFRFFGTLPYLDQFAIYICLHARCTVLVIEIENHKLNQLELSEEIKILAIFLRHNWQIGANGA